MLGIFTIAVLVVSCAFFFQNCSPVSFIAESEELSSEATPCAEGDTNCSSSSIISSCADGEIKRISEIIPMVCPSSSTGVDGIKVRDEVCRNGVFVPATDWVTTLQPQSCQCLISGQIFDVGTRTCACPVGQQVVGQSCQAVSCQGSSQVTEAVACPSGMTGAAFRIGNRTCNQATSQWGSLIWGAPNYSGCSCLNGLIKSADGLSCVSQSASCGVVANKGSSQAQAQCLNGAQVIGVLTKVSSGNSINYSWTCGGTGFSSRTCSDQFTCAGATPESVGGVCTATTTTSTATTGVTSTPLACGSSHKNDFLSAPTQNLCSAGATNSSLVFDSANSIWRWGCSKGSEQVSCVAYKAITPPVSSKCAIKLSAGGEFRTGGDLGKMVRALYCVFLFRDGSINGDMIATYGLNGETIQSFDNDGVAFWSYMYKGGYTQASDRNALLNRFLNAAVGPDLSLVDSKAEVVRATYKLIGQPTDEQGINWWIQNGSYDAQNRGKLAVDIVVGALTPGSAFSTKWNSYCLSVDQNCDTSHPLLGINAFVKWIYSSYFNRVPHYSTDPGGVGYWSANLFKPLPSKNHLDLIHYMLSTAEFWTIPVNGANKRIMDLNHSELVSYLYHLSFRRSPDPAGYDYWLTGSGKTAFESALKSGKNKMAYVELIKTFISSPEFVQTFPAMNPTSLSISYQ